MVVIGYHASHEQLSPRTLLAAVRRAEDAGFDAAMCSDHLAPWTRAQGESGFAWSWLGAALASTSLSFGVVTAPGQRYHPVITAQALATLEEMFPGRFWAALGSGEAINEHVTGDPWPSKHERDQRLRLSVDVIRRLLDGERVTVNGAVHVHDARVWSLPPSPPPLLGAAVSEETARWVAGWADGMITVGSEPATTQEVLAQYRDAGGRGDAMLQIHVSLGADDAEALEIAREQWSHATVPADRMWDLEQPEDFEALAHPDDDDGLRRAVLVSGSVERLADGIAAASEHYDGVYIHHVGEDQSVFLDRCERELLPALRSRL